jgi:hypothetical protein
LKDKVDIIGKDINYGRTINDDEEEPHQEIHLLSQPFLSPLNDVGYISILARVTSANPLHSTMPMIAPNTADL